MGSFVKRLAPWLLWCSVACADAKLPAGGQCVLDNDHTLQCGAAADGGTSTPDTYLGYRCSGSARPDEDPKYVEAVPQGSVCADRGARDDAGVQGYCCTPRTTSCAFNPVALCDEGSYGFECRGADRPDAINAALRCGNGLVRGDLIDYCCSGMPQEPGCLQTDSVACSSRLMGFSCQRGSLPRAEQLGANKSRADLYRLLCSAPMSASNPDYQNYCCYTPAPLPARASCVSHTAVAGCEAGRFGFACYGPDRPEDEYLAMRCPDPGVAGVSAEGYPATLYCCDFQ